MPKTFESQLFLAVAAFLVFLGVVYLVFADDAAGVVLLWAVGIFAGITSLYVGRHQMATLADVERQEWGSELTLADGPPEADEPPGDPLYLPPGSLWPSIMATGAILLATGFAVGLWVALPGVLVFTFGVVGFVAEGRARR